MERYICIHAHFYQPPRENPWLEAVELQDSAYPYHDWNKRIADECYAPNTASRILDKNRKIVEIVNNYSKISFNFGPTLLSWLEDKEPEAYSAILEADKISQERFSGHGSALAQAYNHIIMPLANERDKRTQVIWGIKDFERRFGRFPEGMWLAETAVDNVTLEILAEYGIKFTILSPYQAKKVKKIDAKESRDATGGKIDPRLPYLCRLPSGKTINLFFYDGPISNDIAFGKLLRSGENFSSSLMNAFVKEDYPQLVNIATDGETYGHHHRFGDMALAYCLYNIESKKLATITNYGEFLERHPPQYEVEIIENSSWSCAHGVERWRANCGCRIGTQPNWQQEWRAPLRGAMDWLRDSISQIYEEQLTPLINDPWKARDDYIRVILDRSRHNSEGFLKEQSGRDLSPEEKSKALKLLEMQRHSLLMYTSCGWFFDDVSSIETIQIMQYAARVMQLAKEVAGIDLEPAYIKLLERAPSNIDEYRNGSGVYDIFVKPVVLDFLRVGGHFAISSLFEEYPDIINIYSYTAKSDIYDRVDMGRLKLAVGRADIVSEITWEESQIAFAVLHLGDHNLIGGVRLYGGEEPFNKMTKEFKAKFSKSGVSDVILLMDKHFGGHNYSLWHLFKDEQRKILNQIISSTLEEVESSFRSIYEHHYPVMQVMNESKTPLPKALAATAEFIVNQDLRSVLEGEESDIDVEKLKRLSEEVKKWSVMLDHTMLDYIATQMLDRLMKRFSVLNEDVELLETINAVINTLNELSLELNIWKAQNIYFDMNKKMLAEMLGKAKDGDETAKRWIKGFEQLGNYLKVTTA